MDKHRPMLGKQNHRIGRNRLKGKNGDPMNAIMNATRLNFRKLLRWLADFLYPFHFFVQINASRNAVAHRNYGHRRIGFSKSTMYAML